MGKGTASYGDDPAGSTLDEVRLLVGDTDVERAKLSDAEINHFLASEGGTMYAALQAARAILARLADRVTYATGRVSKSVSDQFTHYQEVVADLESRAQTSVAPYAGGISESDRETDAADSDLTQPYFTTDMLDSPDVVNPTGE